MKDRNIFIILIPPVPVAFILSPAIWTVLGYPRVELFYLMMTFNLTYFLLIMLGLFVEHWLSKGGTLQHQLRKTFRLKKLNIKTSGIREFFHTDFAIPERLNILSFLIGLTVSLGVWIFSGLNEVDWETRVRFLYFTFIGSGLGFWIWTLPISTRYIKEKAKEKARKLKTLDLESSRLSEFIFEDIPDLDQLQRISLGINELRTLDLTPLAGSTNLVELILYYNRLETIDLSPLASCPNLEYLDLAINNLETIDLTPLRSCIKLTAVNLGGNETSAIDLSPLSECRDLEILTIDGMKLREVDLSPLENCSKLKFLKLNDNEMSSVDITPLFECKQLIDFEIDRIDLITNLNREIEDWPEGVRKYKRFFKAF